MYRPEFVVDSHRVLEWVNSITVIHNQIANAELFRAGFNLCFLQQCMCEVLRNLEAKEKQMVADKIK